MKKRMFVLLTLPLLLTACGGVRAPAPRTLTEDVLTFLSLERRQLRSVTFLSDVRQAPDERRDVSQARDGSVLAWTTERGDLYIAADGGVIAPESCRDLFRNCYFLESVAFGDAFDTSGVTDMSGMFYACQELTSLDLRGFDTSGVTDMSGMFDACERLTALDVSAFDTSNVTNMKSMFCNCHELMELDISGFDVSKVEYAESMFFCCSGVTEEDVNKLDLSNAADAALAFRLDVGDLADMRYVSDGRQYQSKE